jgi:hypothetical protein
MEYGIGFGFLFVLFILFFCFTAGIVIFAIVIGVCKWNKNNNSPRLTVDATVVSKRTNVSHHHHDGHMHTSTTYYVTFQVASGDRMELHVSGREYGVLIEGDYGKLTFQGTRYLGFQRVCNSNQQANARFKYPQ